MRFHENTVVYLCDDGKIGRAVPGVITRLTNKKLYVDFAFQGKVYTGEFPRHADRHGCRGAYVTLDWSIQQNLFGLPGNWFSLLTREQFTALWPTGSREAEAFALQQVFYEVKCLAEKLDQPLWLQQNWRSLLRKINHKNMNKNRPRWFVIQKDENERKTDG